MTPTYLFILFVTLVSPAPAAGLIPVQIYDAYPTLTACQKDGPKQVAKLSSVAGKKYAFACIKFQLAANEYGRAV